VKTIEDDAEGETIPAVRDELYRSKRQNLCTTGPPLTLYRSAFGGPSFGWRIKKAPQPEGPSPVRCGGALHKECVRRLTEKTGYAFERVFLGNAVNGGRGNRLSRRLAPPGAALRGAALH